MSDQKSPQQGKRPAWAQHMDDSAWDEFYASRQGKNQQSDDAGASRNAPEDRNSNIQEEIISASAKSIFGKDDSDLENEKQDGGISISGR